MGLLDFPGPLYGWFDGLLAGALPPLIRILLWGIAGGLASMGLYALLAPQQRIARGKREVAQARQALDRHDGALADAGPLIGRMLRLSLGQVRLTTTPALIASVPLLTLLAWMSTAYGYRFPEPGQAPIVETQPAAAEAEWVQFAGTPPAIVLHGPGGQVVQLDLPVPVPVIHERRWWNSILGNPAGYLPDSAGIDRVHVSLPRREYLSVGPAWARGWEVPFFSAVVVASLALKLGARIE